MELQTTHKWILCTISETDKYHNLHPAKQISVLKLSISLKVHFTGLNKCTGAQISKAALTLAHAFTQPWAALCKYKSLHRFVRSCTQHNTSL